MSPSGTQVATSKIRKKIYFALFASLLIVTAIVTIVAAVISRNKSTNNIDYKIAAHPVVRSSCSLTFYPQLCFSALSKVPDAASKITSPKDVIAMSLNVTITAVQKNYFSIKKLTSARSGGRTKRDKAALHDCLEMVDETLDELHKIKQELQEYPAVNKSISQQADELKILLSASMTNQETCLDGFSHDKADKKVRKTLIKGQIYVFKMCSNALAMIKNLTDTDMANEVQTSRRHLGELENEKGWPEWLSAGDRRLLQSTTVTPDVTVAADGTGNYLTVSEAVAAAPASSSTRYIIKIKEGVYREVVDVPKSKTNLMFVGDGRANTIITASNNVVDGRTTFNSATVAVVGTGFLARDITIQNAAGPSKHQAVALRVGADFSAFYRCGFIAYQDTLYVHSLRQFFVNCYIAGSVDFIFGNSAVVIQNTDIHARRPGDKQKNMVTAQGRDDPNQNTGIVIQKCRIGATSDLLPVIDEFPTYLGRPWKQYSRTVVMQTEISDVINPAGWFEWDGDFALDTLFYAEYANTGPGADTSNRVTWKGYRVITDASEVEMFTAENFISGGSWLSSTGFPYTLGL
ncbi:pectinesterase-like [Pistacia vera]|uniref:pectinesterase-like n=1 Tax=Pistacia vera TaxID=55513 RepID=UPI001262FA17|nr:pectinesterase-like [Pistacia vera]